MNNNNTTPGPATACQELSPEQAAHQASLWYVGVILSLVGACIGNLGIVCQKYSLNREAALRGENNQRAYVCQPFWALGLLFVVLGSVTDLAALGYAAQSLVTPVATFTLVANLVFAHFLLKEAIGRYEIVGTFLIMTGVILVAVFADKRPQCYDLDDLIALYSKPGFIAYAIFVIVLIILLYALIRYTGKVRRIYDENHPLYIRMVKLSPVFYGSLSAVIGAQSVLFAKSAIELLKVSIDGFNQFDKGLSWVIVIATICCVVGQIHWMAQGLKFFDAMLIVPMFQSIYTLGAIVSGAVYFGEFQYFSLTQSLCFPLGVIIIISGVQVLTLRQRPGSAGDKAAIGQAIIDESSETGSTSRTTTTDNQFKSDLSIDIATANEPSITGLDSRRSFRSFKSQQDFDILSPSEKKKVIEMNAQKMVDGNYFGVMLYEEFPTHVHIPAVHLPELHLPRLRQLLGTSSSFSATTSNVNESSPGAVPESLAKRAAKRVSLSLRREGYRKSKPREVGIGEEEEEEEQQQQQQQQLRQEKRGDVEMSIKSSLEETTDIPSAVFSSSSTSATAGAAVGAPATTTTTTYSKVAVENEDKKITKAEERKSLLKTDDDSGGVEGDEITKDRLTNQ